MELLPLFQEAWIREYAPDQVFFFQGDLGEVMFFILRGKVEIRMNTPDGSDFLVATLGPGEFFGEMAVLEKAPRSALARALEDCVVVELGPEEFAGVLKEDPKFGIRVMRTLTQRVRLLSSHLVQCLQKGAKEDLDKGEAQKEEYAPLQRSPELETLKRALESRKELYSKEEAPEEHRRFLFTNEVACPSCQNLFRVKMARSSKLVLERVDQDLRERYTAFEPLWYRIWICSHCGYARFFTEFRQWDPRYRKYFSPARTREGFLLRFSSLRNSYEVIDSYLYLLHLNQHLKVSSLDLSKIWLALSWLYNDRNDTQGLTLASEHAYFHLKEVFEEKNLHLLPEQRARIAVVLGQLAIRLQEEEKAKDYYRQVVQLAPKDPLVLKLAQMALKSFL